MLEHVRLIKPFANSVEMKRCFSPPPPSFCFVFFVVVVLLLVFVKGGVGGGLNYYFFLLLFWLAFSKLREFIFKKSCSQRRSI